MAWYDAAGVTLGDVVRVKEIIGYEDDPEMGVGDGPSVSGVGYVGPRVQKRFYRDTDRKVLGGVCGGLAYYTGLDLNLVRILAVVALFLAGLSFWVYIVMWVVIPPADTDARRLEMRGYAVTGENVSRLHAGDL